jgi:TonB family protein
MPITQIPFQDPPVAPPEKPQPEQLGLYDSQDWETAYRELDARVPHLLIQLQDDLQRSRRREAAWISIIAHLILCIILWNLAVIEKTLGWHHAVVVPVDTSQSKNLTFLTLPPDLQKAPRKPNTNIMSDKDRIAMTRHPELDAKDLQKTLPSPPAGAPGLRGPKAPPAAPAQPATQAQNQPQTQQPQQAQPSAPRPQVDPNQIAKLQTPPQPNNSFSKYAQGMSAGSAIQQATQDAAARRAAGGGQEGGFGIDRPAHGRQFGNAEVLSDTNGWDYGPYLERILQDIRENWYHLIPESAEMKKGKLAVDFAIMRDGHVQGLMVKMSSGDVALDRPAYGSITASDPFPPLPPEFTGPYLELRIRFYYCGDMPTSQCVDRLQ